MAQNNKALLELLQFELKFLRDGGYGRSPRTSWRATHIFEDSPVCPNFNDPSHPTPCEHCQLMQFVPRERQEEAVPCRFIPLTPQGETIEQFYRCGTQQELEAALESWLQKQIERLERAQDTDRD
ncbi:MAG: hypothetical protein JST79_09150 [Acidobacteria bacterium]|jgi:hypothetical protein|nr:hypothetical protein [Acidobacteriota bacterium]